MLINSNLLGFTLILLVVVNQVSISSCSPVMYDEDGDLIMEDASDPGPDAEDTSPNGWSQSHFDLNKEDQVTTQLDLGLAL